MSGLGSAPMGSSPYGIGTPSTAPVPGGRVQQDPLTGRSLDSRLIDPSTRDYAFDDYGRIKGMSGTRQMVYLACATDKGSSAVRDMGNEVRSIDRITANFQKRVQDTYTAALEHLTSRRLIEIKAITVKAVRPGANIVNVRWKDLTTGRDDSLDVT